MRRRSRMTARRTGRRLSSARPPERAQKGDDEREVVKQLKQRISDIEQRIGLVKAEADSLQAAGSDSSPGWQGSWKVISNKFKVLNEEYEEAIELLRLELDRPLHDHPLVSSIEVFGVEAWNTARRQNSHAPINLSSAYITGKLPGIDLSCADLSEARMHFADLTGANLSGANLMGAVLRRAKLTGANLSGAQLYSADFHDADLSAADLSGVVAVPADFTRARLIETHLTSAELVGANFDEADLTGATLTDAKFTNASLDDAILCRVIGERANFVGVRLNGVQLHNAVLRECDFALAQLIGTNLPNADISGSRVYGCTVWNANIKGAVQKDLVITPADEEPALVIDNLEIAQFMYLILNNERLRNVIDTVTSKVVLILGNFTVERKLILDTLKEQLRRSGYVPVLFDFTRPSSRDLTQTVSILAHLARFIVADLTDPRSVPHELATIIPQCVVPVQPLLAEKPLGGEAGRNAVEYSMFRDLQQRYRWVSPVLRYDPRKPSIDVLVRSIIDSSERKAAQLTESLSGV